MVAGCKWLLCLSSQLAVLSCLAECEFWPPLLSLLKLKVDFDLGRCEVCCCGWCVGYWVWPEGACLCSIATDMARDGLCVGPWSSLERVLGEIGKLGIQGIPMLLGALW